MRYSIYLLFDENIETAIKNLRARFDEKLGRKIVKNIKYFMRHTTYKMPPHLSLFVFDGVDQDKVIKKFNEFVDSIVSFEVDLYTTDRFRGEETCALFVKPRLTEELKNCYLRCLDLFSDSFIMPPYRSFKKWQPHVTLTKILTEVAFLEAEAFVEESWKPIVGRVRKIGLINVKKPEEALAERVF